jgi:hypothetical protein
MGQVKTMTIAGATVTNTGTGTATLAVGSAYDQVSLQMVITKTSGTVGGTVSLQGSLDGTSYLTLPNSATLGGAGTFTATDVASQIVGFTVIGSPYEFYRMSYTGTGTMVAVISAAKIVGKRY